MGGFEPCWFFDFTKSYTLKFKLNCKALDHTGQTDLKEMNVGYSYQDVISIEPVEESAAAPPHIARDRAIVSLEFRDWKWLSNFKRFTSEVTDSDVLNGNKEGQITIDFNQMTESDK